jgi:competence protein ComFC
MSILREIRKVAEAALGLVYPPHCAACGSETAPGIYICAKCAKGAISIKAPRCERCSQPFDGDITGTFTCSNCSDRDYSFDCAVSCYLARGVVREFIHWFKYNRRVELRHPLADWAAVAFDDERIRCRPFDALVPVPLHFRRQLGRGFNQAAELASLLGPRAGVPVLRALKRIRYTTTQTAFDRSERMENLRGAFRVRHPATVLNRHLILVDDVFTTGSTVEECARVLRDAGAASVRALTVARG